MFVRLKDIIRQRKTGQKALLLIPGIVAYYILNAEIITNAHVTEIGGRLTMVYIVVVGLITANSLLLGFQDIYSRSGKDKQHPMKGLVQAIQIVMFFIGTIITVGILIDKSPAALLTGLGASAAVLMLVFKDSILGFVAGVQLSRNNMIRIGDWIQMPDGSANGTVEEITLNTVKVRNWDNTITTIPPYTLVSTPFKNWRGMQESGGRRADKMIYIDVNSMQVCTQEMIDEIHREFPVMDSSKTDNANTILTNVQLYRTYIERFLRNNAEVNQSLDLIITQKEATPYGLPIEVYFFLKDKAWASFERKQSDIFDHLMTVAPRFGLRLYQRP